jgi:hypothetical protein
MKTKLFIAVVFSFVMMNGYGQRLIALHKPTGTSYYSGTNALLEAYTASANGDTLYLPGGAYSAPANFDKGIVIIGTGHYPDSTMATGKTTINGNVVLNENADHFYVEGVHFTGNFTVNTNQAADQVVMRRCRVDGDVSVLGAQTNPTKRFALIECVLIGNVNLANASDAMVHNCILQYGLVHSTANSICNNIFLTSSSTWPHVIFHGTFANNTVNGNVFFNANITGGTGNTFAYNVIPGSTPNFGSAFVATNNFLNVVFTDLFENQSGNQFNYSHNYHFKTPSVYIDDLQREVSIYGGLFPYKEGAVPASPHISTKNIAGTTDNSGKLNVQIKVIAQDN